MSCIDFTNLLASSVGCAVVVVDDYVAKVVVGVTGSVVAIGTEGANDSDNVEGTIVVTARIIVIGNSSNL